MKSFLLRFLLFILPVIAIYGFAFTFFIYGREFTPVAEVIAKQISATSTVLYQLAYDDNTVAYKIAMTKARNPSVIALGTSRAIQFRSEFFVDPGVFYNASSMHNLADYIRLVKALPEDAKLKLIIFDAEPAFLTTGGQPTTGRQDVSRFELVRNFLTYGWRRVYIDYFAGKLSLSELIQKSRESSAIGIAALTNETGHRTDGSHKPVDISDEERLVAITRQIALSLEVIASNQQGFEPTIVPSQVEDIGRFLSLCRSRGIEVIGFIPPLAQEEHDALLIVDTAYGREMRVAQRLLIDAFGTYKYPLFDVSSLATLGSSNRELLDDTHGSDKTYLRILMHIAKRDPSFAPLLREDAEELLRKSTSDIRVL